MQRNVIMSKRCANFSPIFILSLTIVGGFYFSASADVIVFKDGRRMKADSTWVDEGMIKARQHGGIVGYPEEIVERIEKQQTTQRYPDRGFKYDKLISGMTLEEVMHVAESNDIPLHRAGVISGNKHFNPKVRNYAKTATSFYYKESSLGRWATIYLSFSPVSKRLWLVVASWTTPGKSEQSELCTEISSIICKKYGQPETHHNGLLFDDWKWKINSTGSVQMKAGSNSVKLSYIDEEMEKLKIGEESTIKKQKQKDYHLKDDPKF